MTNDLPSHRVRWIGPALTVGVILLVVVLLLPAIRQSREAARRTQSRNNLKQIGLALHNYHDSYNMFPPGGVFNDEGTAFHGWTTVIAPFIDCSPFYNSVNFNIPWDDPLQAEYFKRNSYQIYLNPSQQPTHSPDGLQLVHYAANQWLLHRNSSVRLKDLETGTSNVLLVGDAFGDFVPFGYPYNWRDPLLPINTHSQGFGYSSHGLQVLLADGSVRWIEKDMATEIHSSFAGPEKLRPTPSQVEEPNQPYRVGDRKIWTTVSLHPDSGRKWRLIGRKNADGQLITASFQSSEKAPQRVERPLDHELSSLASHPSLEVFDGWEVISDAGLQVLTRNPNLQSLKVGGEWITDDGMESISTMTNLKELRVWNSKVTDVGVQKLLTLPHLRKLELSSTSIGAHGLATIASLGSLEELKLGDVDLREGRLAKFTALPQLRALVLEDVDITDDELRMVDPSPTLRKLQFDWFSKEPGVSREAITALQQRFAQVDIATYDRGLYYRERLRQNE